MNKIFKQTKFWMRFSRYLMLGLSVLVLMLVVQPAPKSSLLSREPSAVLADVDNCDSDPNQLGCANPAEVVDEGSIVQPVDLGPANPAEVVEEGPVQPSQPTPEQPASQPAPSCDFEFKYPECDGTGPGWSHEVWQNCHGEYQTRNAHYQGGGTCGESQPAPTCTWDKDQFGECDWSTHTVWNIEVNSCTGDRRRTSVGKSNAPECGFVAPQPSLNCRTEPFEPSACIDSGHRLAYKETPGNGKCDKSVITIEDHSCNPQAPQVPVVQQQVAQAQTQTARQESFQQNQQQQQVQVTAQGGNATITNSGNSTNNGNTVTTRTEVIREVPMISNVGVGTTAPKVLVETKTLPKTGLPALAWAISAFVPAGLRMRKYGKGFNISENPNFLCEERKFKVGA